MEESNSLLSTLLILGSDLVAIGVITVDKSTCSYHNESLIYSQLMTKNRCGSVLNFSTGKSWWYIFLPSIYIAIIVSLL